MVHQESHTRKHKQQLEETSYATSPQSLTMSNHGHTFNRREKDALADHLPRPPPWHPGSRAHSYRYPTPRPPATVGRDRKAPPFTSPGTPTPLP